MFTIFNTGITGILFKMKKQSQKDQWLPVAELVGGAVYASCKTLQRQLLDFCPILCCLKRAAFENNLEA
jgi:hypothetical protein